MATADGIQPLKFPGKQIQERLTEEDTQACVTSRPRGRRREADARDLSGGRGANGNSLAWWRPPEHNGELGLDILRCCDVCGYVLLGRRCVELPQSQPSWTDGEENCSIFTPVLYRPYLKCLMSH